MISLYHILVFFTSRMKLTGFSEVLGEIILATLSTEMPVCSESLSASCWTMEEATFCLWDRNDRGHGSVSGQALTILQWMNFHLAEP